MECAVRSVKPEEGDGKVDQKPAELCVVPKEEEEKAARVCIRHRHYLVKWRGLSYEESTWELEEDVDPLKIEHFLRFKDPPPKEKWKVRPAAWLTGFVRPVV